MSMTAFAEALAKAAKTKGVSVDQLVAPIKAPETTFTSTVPEPEPVKDEPTLAEALDDYTVDDQIAMQEDAEAEAHGVQTDGRDTRQPWEAKPPKSISERIYRHLQTFPVGAVFTTLTLMQDLQISHDKRGAISGFIHTARGAGMIKARSKRGRSFVYEMIDPTVVIDTKPTPGQPGHREPGYPGGKHPVLPKEPVDPVASPPDEPQMGINPPTSKSDILSTLWSLVDEHQRLGSRLQALAGELDQRRLLESYTNDELVEEIKRRLES